LLLEASDSVAFSNDDLLVVVAGARRVFIQEIETGRLVFSSRLPDAKTQNLKFSPTRERLAVAHGKTIYVFPFRRCWVESIAPDALRRQATQGVRSAPAPVELHAKGVGLSRNDAHGASNGRSSTRGVLAYLSTRVSQIGGK
jgi:hypothetical protein